MSLDDLGLLDRAQFYLNGKDCLDAVLKITHEAVATATIFPVKPISMLLLDY